MVDVSELRSLAVRLATEASALVVEARRSGPLAVDTKSTATDLVTQMDRASEALIVAGIRAARPGDGFIGEEGTDEPGTSGVRWLIDPIDGTTNYVYDFPGYAISIAAAVDGETVVGVVHDCVLGEQFVAVRGGGATRDGRPISCNRSVALSQALVATGFGYGAARRRRQATILAEVIGSVRDIRRRGSAALDLCAVACGRVDAYYEGGLGLWDMAAGELIAREAGARTSSLTGGPAGTSVVVAGPGLYEEFFALLTAAGAAEFG
jgi:myo-inositol-1(or 4)-monophosphatase